MLVNQVLNACRRLGYAVALTCQPDGSCEAAAERDGELWVAKVEDRGEETAYLAAVQLAVMLGVDVEDG